MVNVVESFLGPNISTFHHMLINKPPKTTKVASVHPLHQDLQYFPVEPADSIVTAWTPLQKVDPSNGCLQVIPGSHKSGLLDHIYPEVIPPELLSDYSLYSFGRMADTTSFKKLLNFQKQNQFTWKWKKATPYFSTLC